MRDLLRFFHPLSAEKTFGCKIVVFGGGFRQILHVVPKGTRQDIVSKSINSSYLWSSCKVMRLTKNLHLNRMEPGVDFEQLESFANWIAAIGDITLGGPNDGYAKIDIPSKILLSSSSDSIATILESRFPMFKSGNCDHCYLET